LSYDDNNLYLTRDYNSGNKSTPVAIYVGGMAVDYNYLNNVNSDMVESVEIFFNDGFSGINKGTGTKGVLEVNMKKPPEGTKISKDQLSVGDFQLRPGVIKFYLESADSCERRPRI